MSAENDQLNAKEIYDGKRNPIVVELEKEMQVFCDFNSIESYPFGIQMCNFSFSLSGQANKVGVLYILGFSYNLICIKDDRG